MIGFTGKWVVTTIVVVLGAGVAQAQPVVAGQNVADRAHPEYDPVPIAVGAFTLLPTATVRLEATDNYRANNDNRESDVHVAIRPAATLRSNWARHRLSVEGFYEQRVHLKLTDENSNSVGTTVRGLYDISRQTQLSADFFAGSDVESRAALSSFRGSAEPVRFSTLRASLGLAQSFNDLQLTGQASAAKINYNDAKLASGLEIDQDFRDFERLTLGGNARYALRNGIGVIGGLQYDKTRYDFGPGSPGFVPGIALDRESSGFSAQAGVSLELTRLIFGTIQAGYLSRRYQDPLLRDFSGLSFSADVLWNPTPLTSVNLRASRSVEETASTTFSGNTRSDFNLRVDHELYRYILISGDLDYSHFRANGPGPRGDEYGAGVAVRYLIDRRFTLTGSLRHTRRASNVAGLRFDATRASIGLRTAF